MARVQLSKSQLTREKENLASYGRYLPALDLKRQQLMAERARTRRTLAGLEERLRAEIADVGERIPMLADRRMDLDGLVRLDGVEMGTRNVAGVKLPVAERIDVVRQPYGWMVRPHWVDAVRERLAAAIVVKVEAGLAAQRLALLDEAVTRVTQRVNLFEKVLIPQTRENIRRINVHLGDAERAAVVRSKIAKKKRQTQTRAMAPAAPT